MIGFNQEEAVSAIQQTMNIGDAIDILNRNTNDLSGRNEQRNNAKYSVHTL